MEEKNTQKGESVLFEWEAVEQKLSPKEMLWLGLFALAIMAALIFWLKNYLGAITILLLYFIFYLYYGRENRLLKFFLRNNGIETKEKFFFYSTLKSFRIVYQAGSTKELKITGKKKLMPEISIPIGETDPTKIREILLKFIPERD